MPLSPGTWLGRYEVRELIAFGGMGEVYRARDPSLGRDVAVKVPFADLTNDPRRRARFENETRAIAALSHPSILAIHDVGVEGSVCYAVMELLDGETVRARLARGPLEWRRAVELGTEIAEGLAAAHARDIIHRDLKPENVFLTADGHVKILDFGLAHVEPPSLLSGPGATATEPGIALGTAGYMAPEQVRGSGADTRSDIFAFGCLLYEMVTGQRAFRGASAGEVLAAILTEEPRDPADLAPIPAELRQLVLRCLEKSAAARVQDARDLALSLRLVSQAPSPGRTPASPISEPRLPPSSPARSVASPPRIAFLVLAGAAAVAGLLTVSRRSPPAAGRGTIAVLPFVMAGASADGDYMADGLTEGLINSLSRLPDVKVLARTTVFQYKGESDARKAGLALGAGSVLGGTLRLRGGELSVQADLLDVKRGTQVWGGHFDVAVAEASTLPDRIAADVVPALQVRLTGDDRARLSRRRPVNAEAWDLYLRGRYAWNRRTGESTRKGIELFEAALAADPGLALAWTGLADSYDLLAFYGLEPPAEVLPRARDAALKALEIDDHLADAEVALADISYQFDWDWEGAEKRFRRAIALNPSCAAAHHWYSNFLSASGRFEESFVEIEEAHRLDPLNLAIDTDVGLARYWAGAYDRAEARLHETLELEPAFPLAHLYLGLVELRRARFDPAIAQFDAARQSLEGDPDPIALWGHACARAGRMRDAEKALDDLDGLSKQRWVSAFPVAFLLLGMDRREEALAGLQRSYEERVGRLVYLNVEPAFDPLRGDPRFQEIVRRVRIPAPAVTPRGRSGSSSGRRGRGTTGPRSPA